MQKLTITNRGSELITITADRISLQNRHNGPIFSCANVTNVTNPPRHNYPLGVYKAHGVDYTGRWLIIRDSPATRLCPEVGRSIRVLISDNENQPTFT